MNKIKHHFSKKEMEREKAVWLLNITLEVTLTILIIKPVPFKVYKLNK